MNSNADTDKQFIELPVSTTLDEIDVKNIGVSTKYIIAKQEDTIIKILPVSELFRALIVSKEKPDLALGGLGGELSFICLDDYRSLLDIGDISSDVVLIVSAEGSVESIVEYPDKSKQLEIYKAIVENFEEEIFVTDNKGRVILVNAKGEQIIGVSASELEGRLVENLVEQETISNSGALEVLRQKKKVNIMQQVKKDSRWRLCTAVPVVNRRNDIVLTLCTSKDVTELVNLKKELEIKEDDLDRKNTELNHIQEELFAQVNFISKSREMRHVKEKVKKVAPLNLTVLLEGETGSGKDVVARAIHALSSRRDSPFVKVSCATFPDTLIDSELFGYEKGAFTGADSGGRKGKIELADGGTLFLDEIGEISLGAQVKLLEFLQDKNIFRVGGVKKIKVDTRIIAATNRVLGQEVEEGRFRKDFFYRLNLFPITIPPLRSRREDIPALVTYFLEQNNRKYGKNIAFSDQLLEKFLNYEWPGNVRELEHMVERAVVLYDDDGDICAEDSMWDVLRGYRPGDGGVFCPEIIPYGRAKLELARQLVGRAYDLYGSTYKAAEVLEIDQSTVVRILKRINEDKDSSQVQK